MTQRTHLATLAPKGGARATSGHKLARRNGDHLYWKGSFIPYNPILAAFLNTFDDPWSARWIDEHAYAR